MKRFVTFCNVALIAAGLSSQTAIAQPTHEQANTTPETLDFTGMSLEELLEAEITPINVLGSHTHLKGEIMFGYRFSYQRFEGNRSGTRHVGMDEVFERYRVHHTWMDMYMHMFELMYAPSDRWTVMVMPHYMEMEMEHVRRADRSTFVSDSSGFGDTEVMGLYNVLGDPRSGPHRLVVGGGVSLPTGSVNKEFKGADLEYSMQLGSGTFDLLPSVTYLGHAESLSWGAQAAARVRTGENSAGYRLGHQYRLGAWTHYKLRDWVGPSLRLEWKQWGNIHGEDDRLDPMHNAAFDADLQKGRRLDLLGGLHFYVHRGPVKGLRFSAEGGVPVYQHLAGPNLETDWMITFSLSYVLR